MKSRNLITRILFSLFAIVLLATVSAAQTAPAKSSKKAKTDSAMAAPADADLLDINSATKGQLDALPGIGASAESIGRHYEFSGRYGGQGSQRYAGQQLESPRVLSDADDQ